MKKTWWLCALLAIVPSICVAQPKATQQDEDAIGHVLKQWLESFDKRDAGLRNRLLTDDSVFYNAFGMEREGKKNVSSFWQELFASGTFDQGVMKVAKERIRFLKADVAIVDRFEEITGQRGVQTGKPLPPRKVQVTFVLIKIDGEWLVAYYRAGDLRDLQTAR